VAIWPALAFAVLAGAMLPIQAGINAELARGIGGPAAAAFVSFAVGAIGLAVLALLVMRGLPSADRVADVPWWAWVGGLLGAFYVFGAIVTAPRLGAVLLIAAVVAGQSIASVVVDHFGWVGFDEHPVTPGRVAGIALVAAGVLLVRIF
jgi:bacterial/archaeal transporter family-2 protein